MTGSVDDDRVVGPAGHGRRLPARARRPVVRRRGTTTSTSTTSSRATGSTAEARLDAGGPRGPAPSSRSTWTRCASPKVTHRRAGAVKHAQPPGQADRHARRRRSRRARQFTVDVTYAGSPHPVRSEARRGRVGGAQRRRHRRRPAERRTLVVPLQRPARATRRRYRITVTAPSATASSPTAGWWSTRRKASATTWVYEQRRADGDVPRDRADRPLRRQAVAQSAGAASTAVLPAGLRTAASTRPSAGSRR